MTSPSRIRISLLLVLLVSISGTDSGIEGENVLEVAVKSRKPPASKTTAGGACYRGDLVCEKDKLGYAAIATLHHQMDDDENGDIDLEESAEFLREELQYTGRSDHKSKNFHMNDTHITVDDLWGIWKNSSVHNWTVDQVVSWLTYDVELPQYVDTFLMNAVDGSTLPRLAVNNLNFVSNILGIKNLVHKQKLANKATDVVLFGPPKSRHNWYKDVALVTALVIAIGGCWLAYKQNKELEKNMAKTMRDMDSLAKSEQALKELQDKLTTEEQEKRKHIEHKERLEAKIEREISEARLEAQQLKLTKEETDIQLSKMRETHAELERTREELSLAQKELEVRSSLAPSIELQKWLQITYELELIAYNEKKTLAEQQLLNAKESCERLRKKKQALFGSLRMAHSGYIDETESIIIIAKKALEEVKHDLAERQFRWQQIENMCSFSIISNPGIRALIHSTGHTDVYRNCHGGGLLDLSSADLDDFDDVSPTYNAVVAAIQSNGYTISKRRNSPESVKLDAVFRPIISTVKASRHWRRFASGSAKSKASSTRQPVLRGAVKVQGDSTPSTRSTGEGSSRAGSEEKQHVSVIRGLLTKRSSDEKSNSNSHTAADESCDDLADPNAASSHASEENDKGDEACHVEDSPAVTSDQPQFGLYDDEGHDSSSSGSNDIPNRSRPPPLRKQPALRSQATTIDNNSADNASLSDEPTRARSQTNDCMPANMRRKPFRGSPLATVNNGLSSSELILNNTSNIKRSQTTGSQFPKAKHAMSASVSDVNRNKPVTAPPALSSTLHNHDSDASESSDSRENVVASTARKKVKSRIRLFKLFKPKQHSS